jgi:UDP-N-acetylglucosamine diphosphorylase / glucose-1-phosphate thymidylyltransferase / UDP-N-acetylgalactosamine diphosphorylase / glucosamine-1-phosphate N-acetyltransferase / galactosamine-1-phosphate N-acetyltransferase
MIELNELIEGFSDFLGEQKMQPWEIISRISLILDNKILSFSDEYSIDNGIAIHKTAVIESNVILKPPAIIGPKCFIGAGAYLRGGVWLTDHVSVGTGCEIKSSVIFPNSAIAHFNFIGDSIIGRDINFEAGSITANHYNERKDKSIFVSFNGQILEAKTEKFGSIVGDHSKIGANAVLSPGTILSKGTIVKRLELIEQVVL